MVGSGPKQGEPDLIGSGRVREVGFGETGPLEIASSVGLEVIGAASLIGPERLTEPSSWDGEKG